MRRFLRWLLGLQAYADDDAFRTLAHRLDDLVDDMEHLGRRFTKLQGQVTRAWREEDEEEEDVTFEEDNR